LNPKSYNKSSNYIHPSPLSKSKGEAKKQYEISKHAKSPDKAFAGKKSK